MKSLSSPTIPFSRGADTEWFVRFRVAASCSSRSTGPLINRLELLTGGSSIPRRPCHFHYASFRRQGTEEETGRPENLLLISILIKRPSDNDQSKQSAGRQAAACRWRRRCSHTNPQWTQTDCFFFCRDLREKKTSGTTFLCYSVFQCDKYGIITLLSQIQGRKEMLRNNKITAKWQQTDSSNKLQ